MVVRKRKKFSRQRASHTHGWGSKKKHRGAGNRGGKGLAGTGKRADTSKTRHWKDTKYFGKHGFKTRTRNVGVVNAINIGDVEEKLPSLVDSKVVVKEGDVYVVDLKKMGYDKLLGSGKVKSKFKISVDAASKKVIEKVKGVGGEIILPQEESSAE